MIHIDWPKFGCFVAGSVLLGYEHGWKTGLAVALLMVCLDMDDER